MKYKELERLNEIIQKLKSQSNADENIQFVLRLADESVKAETLQELIKNGQSTALMPCMKNKIIRQNSV